MRNEWWVVATEEVDVQSGLAGIPDGASASAIRGRMIMTSPVYVRFFEEIGIEDVP